MKLIVCNCSLVTTANDDWVSVLGLMVSQDVISGAFEPIIIQDDDRRPFSYIRKEKFL